jgi:hypothetical protein
VTEYFRRFGHFGAEGGKASAANMTASERKKRAKKAGDAAAMILTPTERTARAKKAAQARWAKKQTAQKAKATLVGISNAARTREP